MTDFNHDLEPGGHSARDRDQAISAFVYLGEKLKSFYRGEKRKLQKKRASPERADYADAMFHTIEGEIIPRLMLIHKASDYDDAAPAMSRAVPTSDEKKRFLEAVLANSATDTSNCIKSLLERGVSRETIFLDLLGETAKRLGLLWEEDRCDFTEVTIGLCRLHQVVREQSLFYNDRGENIDSEAPRILLTNARGDQHIFGVVIVAEFFRQSGWRVWGEPGAPHDEVANILQNNNFEVLGLSVSKDPDLDDLSKDIRKYRAVSRNPDIKILVGGRFFLEAPDMVSSVGADAMAGDARTAPDACKKLLVTSSLHC